MSERTNRNRKLAWPLIWILLLGAVTVALFVSSAAAWVPDGQWVPVDLISCPYGSICAKWEVEGSALFYCCIPESSAYSTDPEVCRASSRL